MPGIRPESRPYATGLIVLVSLLGDAELGESFGGVLGLPLTYLIDPNGRIVARYQGNGDLAKMEAKIKALLAKRSK